MGKLISKNMLEIEIVGVNIEKIILPYLINIHAYDISRPKYNEIICKIHSKDFKSLKQKFYNYDITILDHYGLSNMPRLMLSYLGVVIALIISISSYLIVSHRTFNIEVVGDSILENDIKHILYDKNIDINKLSTTEIENVILENLDTVSLISCAKIGTTLVISVKEKTMLKSDFLPIYASENMMIRSIKVLQGTANVNVGDIVAVGDILVYPYIIIDGKKSEVYPSCEIIADVWYSGVVKFEETTFDIVESGKEIVNKEYFLSSKKIYSTGKINTFENFNENVTTKCLSNLFIPIYVRETKYSELITVENHHNYDEEYESLVNKSREIAYQKNTTNLEILDENLDITDLNDVKYIRTTIHILKKVS